MKNFSKDAIIINELGIHARCAVKIVNIVQNAKDAIWIKKGDEKVDASSIIDILTLACSKGSKITLIADNQADACILHAVVNMIEKGFGE